MYVHMHIAAHELEMNPNRLPGVPKLPWVCGFSSPSDIRQHVVFSEIATVENSVDAVCGVITELPRAASVCLKHTTVAGDNRRGQQTERRQAVSHVVGSL